MMKELQLWAVMFVKMKRILKMKVQLHIHLLLQNSNRFYITRKTLAYARHRLGSSQLDWQYSAWQCCHLRYLTNKRQKVTFAMDVIAISSTEPARLLMLQVGRHSSLSNGWDTYRRAGGRTGPCASCAHRGAGWVWRLARHDDAVSCTGLHVARWTTVHSTLVKYSGYVGGHMSYDISV